jgi:hypothetical protein
VLTGITASINAIIMVAIQNMIFVDFIFLKF